MLAFLCFVPGITLLIFSKVQPLVLPPTVIDWLFPITILPPEKLLVVLFTRLGHHPISLIDPADLSVFHKQFFVLSFLFFFLSLLIVTLQARASALYQDPRTMPVSILVKGVVIAELLRISMIWVQLMDVRTVQFEALQGVAFHFLHAIAPAGLIMASCGMATGLWQLGAIGYARFSSRKSHLEG